MTDHRLQEELPRVEHKILVSDLFHILAQV